MTWSKSIASGVGKVDVMDILYPHQTGPNAQYVRVVLMESTVPLKSLGPAYAFIRMAWRNGEPAVSRKAARLVRAKSFA